MRGAGPESPGPPPDPNPGLDPDLVPGLDPDLVPAEPPSGIGSPIPAPFSPVVLLVLVAGGIGGCLARYGLSNLLATSPGSWPTSTFIINLAGCCALGALLEYLTRRGPDTRTRRLIRTGLGTGLIGTFTTYSTLAVEIDLFIRDRDLLLAVAYAIASLAGGLLAVAAGTTAIAALTGRPATAGPEGTGR
jgi:fluoride exporter